MSNGRTRFKQARNWFLKFDSRSYNSMTDFINLVIATCQSCYWSCIIDTKNLSNSSAFLEGPRENEEESVQNWTCAQHQMFKLADDILLRFESNCQRQTDIDFEFLATVLGAIRCTVFGEHNAKCKFWNRSSIAFQFAFQVRIKF